MTTLAVLATLMGGPYWQSQGCDHGHPSKVSYDVVSRVLRNHQPLSSRVKRLPHYARCVATRAKSVAVQKHIRASYQWRRLYAHRWPIRFHSLPAGWQSWAYSTGACESGNNPATATGNGYYGAFQFLPSTWWAAGGSGMPNQHSWPYQAVIAVHWAWKAGVSQWPVCGR
jgi:hypothetical protein